MPQMLTFTSFDGTRIAYSDEGDGMLTLLRSYHYNSTWQI